MLVTIKGSKKEYRDLVRRAVWFYAEKLMSKTLVNTLTLTINLTRNLTEKEGAEGFCIRDDWSDIRKTPREFYSGSNAFSRRRRRRLISNHVLRWHLRCSQGSDADP